MENNGHKEWELVEAEFRRIKLKKGEVLAVTIPRIWPEDEYPGVIKRTQEIFNKVFPNNKTLVLVEGVKIEAISSDVGLGDYNLSEVCTCDSLESPSIGCSVHGTKQG